MKKLIASMIVLLAPFAIPFAAFSQSNPASTENWLEQYYKIKDALVAGNAGTAATAAKELSNQVKSSSGKKEEPKILTDANTIAGTRDLVKQRAAFQNLSESVIALIKTSRQSKPAYIMYCPMKKAYWVSAVEQIKNPYYGNSMLTCGNISETLK